MNTTGFCSKCGQQITGDSLFCPNCGMSLENRQTSNGSGVRIPAWKRVEMEKAGMEVPAQAPSTASGFAQRPQTTAASDQEHVPPEILAEEYPMKWYKFVIYFQLFAGAVLNFLSALQYLSGTAIGLVPGTPNRELYPLISGLQTIDMIYGACVVGAVILAMVARSALKNFKYSGPQLYYAVLVCNGVLPVLYALMAGSMLPDVTLNIGALVVQLIPTVIQVVLNRVYFNKRGMLFTN